MGTNFSFRTFLALAAAPALAGPSVSCPKTGLRAEISSPPLKFRTRSAMVAFANAKPGSAGYTTGAAAQLECNYVVGAKQPLVLEIPVSEAPKQAASACPQSGLTAMIANIPQGAKNQESKSTATSGTSAPAVKSIFP